MLPARAFSALRLADVLPSCLAAMSGRANPLGLPAVAKAVVVLVDGLGASAIRARAGHARFLSSRMDRRSVIESVFPATTAAGIATLTTGVEPGRHGLVGYRVLDAAGDRTVNQLTGWDDGMDPGVWQRMPTVFEQARQEAIASFSVGAPRFAGSGFTRAVLRGSEYVPAESLADRFDAARRILRTHDRVLVYLYVAELDVAAHARGWESDRWLAELEAVDGELSRFAAGLAADEGLLVTADHGVLDVPAEKHVLFDTVPELVAGVRHVGGDPRCLQLYLEPGVSGEAVATAWRAVEGERAWVMTRDEAIGAGLFGEVDDAVRPRIGDVIVSARKRVAYYDSRDANTSAQRMVGQHGALTDEELRVPLVRAGAFART
ncbi:alkaline phosphatase family protein [Cryobacterium tepidiphilum]|uniref:Alkaline phosphatase family protein n=2 Tax=Cryobacterium tepidiphilum TaxID=2486026 RepID=A0A3M8LA10_9MICO|nr:alkaline phosphatase family protein [Cryobacterium tepidiphilum]